MAIELHHLHPGHDDELSRLKERIAELESAIDKEKSWSETLSKNGVTMSHEIERLKSENERMKARIAELEEERRWRKCIDEMPSNGQEVLVWLTAGGSHGFVLTSTYLDSQWYYGEDPQGCKPSHWMPLPSAPKEEK